VNDSSYTPPSKPMPACSRTVLWKPSAPTTYRALFTSPSSNVVVTPSGVCVTEVSVFGRMTVPPISVSRSSRSRSVVACGTINEYG